MKRAVKITFKMHDLQERLWGLKINTSVRYANISREVMWAGNYE